MKIRALQRKMYKLVRFRINLEKWQYFKWNQDNSIERDSKEEIDF
jgi:hypothetical protein